MKKKPQKKSDTSNNISIGSISDVKGGSIQIAGGNINSLQSNHADNSILQAFTTINKRIDLLPEGPSKVLAQSAVEGLKAESERGEYANEENVEQWFKSLASIAPDIFEVAIQTFINPISGLSLAFQKIAKKASEEKT